MGWRLDLGTVPQAGSPELDPELDPEQARVVAHRSGPLLVLAGPGTGKTTTIVEAIRARLHDAQDPLPAESILALTFGRRAALDLRDRVTARVGGGLVPMVTTFHSFAYALLRQTATLDEYANPPRLMSGAEEDVRIRELLRGAVVDGTIEWPDDLVGALPTLGLANEVRAVLARAREVGLDGPGLERVGRASGRPAWQAVGRLARQEQQVMALENVLDYGELLVRAVVRAGEPDVRAWLHARYRAIYVDEYQDTDPLQVALLQALVGPATSLVAVGDPDQAIYGFRGADVRGLLSFPSMFRTPDRREAPVVVLRSVRRFGPRIRAAAGVALGSRLPAGLPAEVLRVHRTPECVEVADPQSDDLILVRTFTDRGAQASHVAREIRQAHLRRAVPWSQMAVIVRSSAEIPAMQRALQAMGVPEVVASDEVPLRQEPAVATLLDLLDLAAHPSAAAPARVVDLLTGPVVGLTAGDIRRLGRSLRAAVHRAGFAAPASDRLVRDLVLGPLLAPAGQGDPPHDSAGALLPGAVGDDVASAIARTTGLLVQAREQMEAGAGPEDILWTLWSGGRHPHGWPERLRAAALAGSRSADHDLDAVLALFDTAARLSGRYPGFLGVRTFLEMLADQELPAESVADRGLRAEAVRVLTAHRAKGLEWDEVWVIGIQEGTWPDLRPRGSTLRAEELTSDGVGTGPHPAALLEEERRLLFVACTRARRRLHLSAVDSPLDSGDRPSRFLLDIAQHLGLADLPAVGGRPAYPASLDGMVAELRAVASDAAVSASLRLAAQERLALLAAERDDHGRPLVPLADPRTWWGMRDITTLDRPLRSPDEALAISGSMLDDVLQCPLAWYLQREVHAETPRGPAASFGSIVHAVADFVAKGEVPAELDAMEAELDRVWGALAFEARWQSRAERAEAGLALGRFLDYHRAAERELLATETGVRAEITVPTPSGGEDSVRLTGFIDRIERDAQGRLVAIDLKNMRTAVPTSEIAEHGQLGIYQLLLQQGDVTSGSDLPAAPREVGGAALVQLRLDAGRGSTSAKVQLQAALPSAEASTSGGGEPTWVEVRLGEAAGVLRSDIVRATAGPGCTFCAYATACPAQAEGAPVVP
jgi:superfamily I DNA/RNA helicase/RecB family exonuclease